MGVATAVAIGGLVVSAATSFSQASAAASKERSAAAASAKAMADARKKLEKNYTDEMAIKKEPFELQREALLSQGAQAIQAGQESDRGAEATAGKVMMAQNEAQAGVRTAMGAEMTDIENKKIAEQSRLRDLGVQIDLGEAEGAQQAQRDAEQAGAAATAQGMQSVIGAAQAGATAMSLYGNKSTPTPMGGTSGGSPGTHINEAAAKYSGTSWTPMNTESNALGNTPQFNGANGVVPAAPNPFSGTFKTGNQPMFPQYDAFGNIIR